MHTTRGSEGQVAALVNTALRDEAEACDWRQLALGIAALLAYTPQSQQDVLGEVAHELKSAVGTLRAQAARLDEAATAQSASDSARDLTACIVEHADLMAHAVGAILDVQRLRLGKMRLDLRPVDFARIAERSVTEFQATAPEITVDVVANEFVPVNADHALLSEALACLLKGAAKSGPARKMELRIGPGEGRPERLRAVLTVCGSGRDFQPEDVMQSSSQHAALDLELFIAREIIRLHGGELWVEHSTIGFERALILVLPSSLAVAQ
jgi:K+-sensing histidine kinase KdpD